MDKIHYDEMISNLNRLIQENAFRDKKIYLFGHCNATEELAAALLERGLCVEAILDNNKAKHGNKYNGILIEAPQVILASGQGQAAVCIVARAYAEMAAQLNRLGYRGPIYKLADYNSFAEYSLTEETIVRKEMRVKKGIELLQDMERKYPEHFRVMCPFAALGDVYFVMSYLPLFLKSREVSRAVIMVAGNACAQVVRIFGAYETEVFSQEDIDCAVQAAIYIEDTNSFIAHQDRPYVVDLHKALYLKCIPLEQIYCCGVFGLPMGTQAHKPVHMEQYGGLEQIREGKAILFSPYAKSVTELPEAFWTRIVDDCLSKGYQCFTNVAGTEKPLPGTAPISPAISEIRSVVERAGTFIGIRSGICDVLKEAECRKVALYPDYHYCNTKWKAIDMYAIEGWKNIVVNEGFRWDGDLEEVLWKKA